MTREKALVHQSEQRKWYQMEINDFVEPEIAVTAAVAAAIFSPRARKVMRKGLVYGMAGVLAAGDMVTSFAHSVGQGVQQAGESTARSPQEAEKSESEMEKTGEMDKEPEIAATSRRKNATKAEAAKEAEKARGKSA